MTPVEKAAKAIYEGRNGKGCDPWGRLPSAHKAPYLSDALATLKAIWEPSKNMSDAGIRARAEGLGSERIVNAFHAMIDAAIAEHGDEQ